MVRHHSCLLTHPINEAKVRSNPDAGKSPFVPAGKSDCCTQNRNTVLLHFPGSHFTSPLFLTLQHIHHLTAPECSTWVYSPRPHSERANKRIVHTLKRAVL